ncbi:hypothetical protein [Virgibacillus sp. DJP39]|uniref:hypothetical protein n=1 Tax=Virgibacillus sp. DJP39 TaxID=3409790 RepID=UPI003BB504F5
MKRFLLVVCLLLWAAACSSQPVYDDDEVAAIVMDEKITVGEIRFIYDVNDQELPKMVKEFVKEEIMVQKAKEMGLDISEEAEETLAFTHLPPEDSEDPLRKFVEKQAKKVGMSEEKYYQDYLKKTTKRSQYVNQYILKELGHPHSDNENDYVDNVNKHVNNLITKYADEIEILIK